MTWEEPITVERASVRFWMIGLVAGLLLTIGYHLIPWPAAQDAVFVVVFGGAAVLVARRAIGSSSVEPRVWGAWALGLGLFACGTVAHFVARIVRGDLPDIPHVADALFVAAFLSLLVGFMLALPRGRDRDLLIDYMTGVAATGGAIILLLVPWATERVSPAEWGLLALYVLLCLVVLLGALRVIFGAQRWTPALTCVVAASLLLLGTQTAYALLGLADLYDTGHAIDTGWHLAALLWALAALHPSSARGLVPLTAGAPNPLTGPRIALLAYALLVLPVVRLGQYAAGQGPTGPVFALAMATVGVLVLLRVVVIARRLQELADEQQELLAEQHQLRLSYDLALQAANTHTWEWDVVKGSLHFSDHARPLYGELPATLRDWLALVHPDDVPTLRLAADEAAPENPLQTFEVRVRGDDGQWRRVSCIGRGFFTDGELRRCTGVGMDVTAMREAEQEGARRGVLLEHITKASQVILLRSTYPRFGVTFISENIERILGHPWELWYDAPRVRSLIHPDDLRLLRPLLEDIERQGYGDIEVRLQHRDGDWRHVHFRMQVEDALFDGPPGLVGSAIDVTAQREAEEQLRHAQKLEAVGRLAGGVAHDFNNLLTAMLGYVELARSSEDEDDRVSFLAEVTRAGERATSLVDQLLAFSRRRSSHPVPTDVNEAVSSVVRLAERITAGGVELSVDLGEELPPVLVDPGQLEQAVLNVVLNARDASAANGLIQVSTASGWAADGEAGQHDGPSGAYVEIRVHDDGHGMSPEVLERAVEPFFTTKPEGGGTGLGLSSAYGFANQADGSLLIDSAEGVGTTVRIVLPPAQEAVRPAARLASPAPAPPAAGSVLVVEDQPQVRALLVRALEGAGYEVSVAVDGTEAKTLVDAGLVPDLVVSDIVMPGIDGVALARWLRARDERIGVLLISGYSEGRVGDEAHDRGIRFLQKPFTLDKLLAEVRALLNAHA